MDDSHVFDEPDEDLDALAHLVIGAAIEVHRRIGPGYLESVYEEALAVEFRLRKLPFERQKAIPIMYKGHPVGEGRLDFLMNEQLIVELKAVEELGPIHKAQVMSHLRTTNLQLGLLMNFNVTILKEGLRRVIRSPNTSEPPSSER